MLPVMVLLTRLDGVVDRVEGDLAVVEWRSDAFADLPLALLPSETAEGDHLTITFVAQLGPLMAIDEHRLVLLGEARARPIELPPEISLRVGDRYDLRVELDPAD